MKKSILKVVAVFALALIVMGGLQANTAQAAGRGINYIDEDGDGVCDNCLVIGSRQAWGGRMGRGNGNQMNANQGKGNGNQMNANQGKGNQAFAGQGQGQGLGLSEDFVDADNDGVCVNFGTRPMDGSGKQIGGGQGGQGTGGGQGQGFSEDYVDENNDGTCDNYETRPRDSSGRGQGRGRNR